MPVITAPGQVQSAPAQHSQPSRKGKKAWRKHVDVTDVEQGLAELNEEIIHGGVFAERQSNDLFVVDTLGDPSLTKRLPVSSKKLKADEVIAARSKVPAVSMRKRPAGRMGDGIVPAKRHRPDYVSQKELHRLRRVADGQHESALGVSEAAYDVWATPTTTQPAVKEGDVEKPLDFLPAKPKTKVPVMLGRNPISLAANGKKIPAVTKPTSGYSYNPTFPDYENRFTEESDKAVKAERQRLAKLEADRLKQEAAARSAAEAEAAEARADLSEWEESAWEGFESGGEELSVQVKCPQRKTPAQRNRAKRRKEEKRRKKHEVHMRRRDAQAEHIRQIARAVAEREKERALEKEEMSDGSIEGYDDVLRRRPLGRYKLPEKDLELVLPDELRDSLRLLKPEGNLLKDRYRNMLVRGKLESRVRVPYRKQRKVKFTEKWTHKDFSLF